MRINLKKTAILSATTALLGLAGMSAASAADFEDFARVISVTPQVEQVNMPRQECRTEYENVQRQQPQRERSAGGSIIGGIAGGLLGSQVGGGNGRIAAAAAGALTGAIVGDRVDNGNNDSNRGQSTYESQPVRRCANVDRWETRNNGYAVTYEYHNRTYTSIMPYDPGSRLKLHVSLTPRP
ncbi:glycine zipper 2TM domain-containing protein [Undibacterium sp. RuTC16W]|uniref:glycine zipper 2TM domain-containing protein n=1 Tax=Undibacterium sp. RuTC16W TaxID=3413048 RepID=UPI003BF214E4